MKNLILGILVMLLPLAATAQDDQNNVANVIIVLDDSGSMRAGISGAQNRMEAAKRAAIAGVEALPPGSFVGVYALNKKWVYDLQRYEVGMFKQAVSSVQHGGGTPLGDAMGTANKSLQDRYNATNGYGTYTILVITDGEASDPAVMQSEARRILNKSYMRLNAIGVGMIGSHMLKTDVCQGCYADVKDAHTLASTVVSMLAEDSADHPLELSEEAELARKNIDPELLFAMAKAVMDKPAAPAAQSATPKPNRGNAGQPQSNSPDGQNEDDKKDGLPFGLFIVIIAAFSIGLTILFSSGR